ncbi:NAD(P)/FAD-dependent oxidoreductase [Amnibacterium endophyticum]|uniref:NAD(P)/FAD-dependent oxidoreductase n=1 Tax=Amnibacterium endophyticum TaxID=2109337 RepID=A0ABW4LFJ3_9MICO
MKDVLIVGAGLAGAACARVCLEAGIAVRVLDRGHRAGGRMATRTLRDAPGGEHPVDTGAPYFTVSDDGFREVADRWRDRGLIREWTDTFWTAGPFGLREPKPGPMRYASTRGIRSLVEDLLTGIEVRQEADVDAVGVHRLVDRAHPEIVVLAMPGPQAARLLQAHHADLAALADQAYAPALALVARFEERTWPEFDGAFVSNVPELSWIADDGRSRGDGAPVLVAHSTPELAADHLDDPSAAQPALLKALRGVLGVHADPVEARVQRWTYAKPTSGRQSTFHLSADGIGLCGDGWAEKSKVEAAWVSGTALGEAIVDRLA